MVRLSALPELLLAPYVVEHCMVFAAQCDDIRQVFITKMVVIHVMRFELFAIKILVTYDTCMIVKLKSCLPYFLPMRMFLDVFVVVHS